MLLFQTITKTYATHPASTQQWANNGPSASADRPLVVQVIAIRAGAAKYFNFYHVLFKH